MSDDDTISFMRPLGMRDTSPVESTTEWDVELSSVLEEFVARCVSDFLASLSSGLKYGAREGGGDENLIRSSSLTKNEYEYE